MLWNIYEIYSFRMHMFSQAEYEKGKQKNVKNVGVTGHLFESLVICDPRTSFYWSRILLIIIYTRKFFFVI